MKPAIKKTLIIVAAVLIIAFIAYFVFYRPKYTIKGVLSKMTFLSKEQKEALREGAETLKKVKETTAESAVAVWIKMCKEDLYYTEAMALVGLAAANMETVGTLDSATRAKIETQLNNMI